MKTNTQARALCGVLILASFAFTGCVASFGSKLESSPTYTTTLGQELIDLQRAHDAGAINETEFKQQREKIIAQRQLTLTTKAKCPEAPASEPTATVR